MAIYRITSAVIAVLLLQACGRDPHNVPITSKNRDTFMDEIKDMKGLTVDEVRLLIAYQVRGGISKAFGGKERNPAGKTVGELIQEARKDADAEKTETDKQKRLADESKAKQEALAAELRKAVNVAVYEKGFLPSNPMGGRYQDYITIRCAYENTSSKEIRAFKGVVVFQDLFGSDIYRVNLTISDPIRTGEKANWNGTINFNQFIDAQRRLRDADLKNMKVVWMPVSVLFADGTKVGDADD
jgi:hypothetical protein